VPAETLAIHNAGVFRVLLSVRELRALGSLVWRRSKVAEAKSVVATRNVRVHSAPIRHATGERRRRLADERRQRAWNSASARGRRVSRIRLSRLAGVASVFSAADRAQPDAQQGARGTVLARRRRRRDGGRLADALPAYRRCRGSQHSVQPRGPRHGLARGFGAAGLFLADDTSAFRVDRAVGARDWHCARAFSRHHGRDRTHGSDVGMVLFRGDPQWPNLCRDGSLGVLDSGPSARGVYPKERSDLGLASGRQLLDGIQLCFQSDVLRKRGDGCREHGTCAIGLTQSQIRVRLERRLTRAQASVGCGERD